MRRLVLRLTLTMFAFLCTMMVGMFNPAAAGYDCDGVFRPPAYCGGHTKPLCGALPCT